jgi:5-formyltetrahydrofolate cyclo-ligase
MDTKESLRQYFLYRRKNLNPTERVKYSKLVADRFLQWLSRKAIVTLGLYWPVKNELDPFYILRELNMSVTDIAYPRSDPQTKTVTFRHVDSISDLEKGVYGIPEPAEEAPRVFPSVVLVPGIAFDPNCNRLGFGHGFYDRTIANWPRRDTTFIGIGYDFQIFPMLPKEAHDQLLNIVMTPEQEIVGPPRVYPGS